MTITESGASDDMTIGNVRPVKSKNTIPMVPNK